MRAMRFVVVAHRTSETNEALVGAAAALGLEAALLPPRDALRILEPGDVALGRLDVLDTLDGVEHGLDALDRLVAGDVTVLNPSSTLLAAHDKLLTTRALRLAGIPHPQTWLIADGMPAPAPELPLVLKPRFGSWGRDVMLCRTQAELDDAVDAVSRRPWFREHGALVQELVPPLGWDLRMVVAGDRVIGSARRIAAHGEWRTNVSLGGRSEPTDPPATARRLAIATANAVRGDLVGIDLLPLSNGGYLVAEVNGAVDFRPWYANDVGSVYEEAVHELLVKARLRRPRLSVA